MNEESGVRSQESPSQESGVTESGVRIKKEEGRRKKEEGRRKNFLNDQ
jgi:hypothetical protein